MLTGNYCCSAWVCTIRAFKMRFGFDVELGFCFTSAKSFSQLFDVLMMGVGSLFLCRPVWFLVIDRLI